jgi:hypothetical protein
LIFLESQLKLLLQLKGYFLRQCKSLIQRHCLLLLAKVMQVLDIGPYLQLSIGKYFIAW